MKNLLLTTVFAAGLIVPAVAQEFAPQNSQATTQQRLPSQALPNNGAQPGGTAPASPGWVRGDAPTTGTFNSETSDPYFVEHSHGSPQG